MIEVINSFSSQFPSWIATFFLAMLPVTELRGSIPFAIGVYDIAPWLAFVLSVVGDLIPSVLIILFLQPVARWLSLKSRFIKNFFDWWFQHATKKFQKKYSRHGEIALLVLVALPLPLSGAWTAAVASFLFSIPKKRAMILISLGVVIAGSIVTLVSIGAFSLLKI